MFNTLRCTQIAYMISGMVYFMWSLHCGFIIAEPNYPGWWIWLCVLLSSPMLLLVLPGLSTAKRKCS